MGNVFQKRGSASEKHHRTKIKRKKTSSEIKYW